MDLLDRMLIIRTIPYSLDEIIKILGIRAGTEGILRFNIYLGIEMEEGALGLLGEIGLRSSLRFAVQLITPSKILANTSGRPKIKYLFKALLNDRFNILFEKM